MTAPAVGEEPRARYPARLRGHGGGELRVTTSRVCFDAAGGGLLMDVGFRYLLDWRAGAGRGIVLRWQEPAVPGADPQLSDPLFSAAVELAEGADPQDARLALSLAHAEHFPYGSDGLGFYKDEYGDLRNHFDEGDATYPRDRGYDHAVRVPGGYLYAHLAFLLRRLVWLAGGDPAELVADPVDESYPRAKAFVLANGGRTPLEQDLFRRLVRLRAHCPAGEDWSAWGGIPVPWDDRQRGAPSAAERLGEEADRLEKRLRAQEEQMRQPGARGDRRGTVPAHGSEIGCTRGFSGGARAGQMKFRRNELAVARRAAEIAGMTGSAPWKEAGYETRVKDAIAERVDAGRDVSGYVPEFVSIGPADAGALGPGGLGARLSEAGREISEFGRRLGGPRPPARGRARAARDGAGRPAGAAAGGPAGGAAARLASGADELARQVGLQERHAAAHGDDGALDEAAPASDSRIGCSHGFPGGTLRDRLAHRRKELATARRVAEIASGAAHAPWGDPGFVARVMEAVADKAFAGEDVSGYMPGFVEADPGAAGPGKRPEEA